MKDKRKVVFSAINVVLPIVLGAFVYYLISPDVLFVKQIDSFWGSGIHMTLISGKNPCIIFIRNYLLDMLWGYALVYALFFSLGNNVASLKGVFLIAFSFSAAIELFQLAPMIQGTFDLWDICGELLAEAGAVFVIKKYFSKGGTNG